MTDKPRELILFGYHHDTLPELVVRDLNAMPPGSAPLETLSHDHQYTLHWDAELLDWIVTELPR